MLPNLPDDPNGHTPAGKFAPGNKWAVGRRDGMQRRASRLRAALLRAVTVDDIREVIESLLAQAKAGDVVAIKELLDRTIGKSKSTHELVGPGGGPLQVGVAMINLSRLSTDELQTLRALVGKAEGKEL